MSVNPLSTPTPRQQAAQVLNELRAALGARGITLPSLGLDGVSLAASDLDPARCPLIELGRANLPTVRALTQALVIGPADEH